MRRKMIVGQDEETLTQRYNQYIDYLKKIYAYEVTDRKYIINYFIDTHTYLDKEDVKNFITSLLDKSDK